MAVKMRLQRKGRRKNPFYHIVVADARAPRDGRFIEKLGVYNPMTKPATIDLDRDKAYDWLLKGAQPTDTVRAILRLKGVMYRKHLMRGVKKEAMTIEDADRLYQEWIDAKEAKLASRAEEAKEDVKKHHVKVFGIPGAKKVEPEVEEETPAVEEAPAAAAVDEALAAEVVEEAPAADESPEETPEEPSSDTEEDENK